jgi:hypothetical protein
MSNFLLPAEEADIYNFVESHFAASNCVTTASTEQSPSSEDNSRFSIH